MFNSSDCDTLKKSIVMKIEKDKKQHFGVSALIAFFASLLLNFIGGTILVSAVGGFLASIGTGFGKEYGDEVNPYNKWDWKDILFDAIGALTGALIGVWAMLLR